MPVLRWIAKAWMWYFKDFWKYLGFLVTVAGVIAVLQALLVYPVQVITAIVIGVVVIAAWCFWID